MDLSNWVEIAKKLGAINEEGQENSSSDKAREAIELLLGEDFCRESVRHYVSLGAGRELLRGVLWQLHPFSAMDECYRIFKDAPDVQNKRDAVELLRVVADRRALNWVSEFLEYDDVGVQNWAIGIVDQLIFSELCEPEEVESILCIAASHSNEYVRDQEKNIRAMLASNEEQDKVLSEFYERKNA
ncbi:hypothetical protein [Reinekea sp. G2M2-21]|uniref:hypothetical protein n=1 Tax=Reinekea sp. G2M2-21 TaxID=2788942 RepID=UPI0018AA0CF3|nr:hypothetical protein [Reinekea sp. G2M2-21]